MILLYLGAIIAANVSVVLFGPAWSVVNAFLFIGIDLTTRDALHERWQGRRLWWRMLTLIAIGGAISWLLTPGAGLIAIASTVAFVTASIVDTLVYSLLRHSQRRVRVNGSNVVSAGVDSLVFPLLAFGLPLMVPIVIGQWLAKVFGGAIWYEVIRVVSIRKGHVRPTGHVVPLDGEQGT